MKNYKLRSFGPEWVMAWLLVQCAAGGAWLAVQPLTPLLGTWILAQFAAAAACLAVSFVVEKAKA